MRSMVSGFPRHPARRVSSGYGHGSEDLEDALGVAENLLHAWRKKCASAAEQVRRERAGETAEEEPKRLRCEVTQLKQERDVLRKSVAVFASDHGTWETMAK